MNDIFYTATMAKIHADQGHLEKAADIYRRLLEKEPEREDLIEALTDTEESIQQARNEDLSLLVGEWTKLVLRLHSS